VRRVRAPFLPFSCLLRLVRYSKKCGTKRLRLSVTSALDSRIPMPADTPSITQLPMIGCWSFAGATNC